MLVLMRKIGETVMIGDEIEITVLEVREGRVKLGFAARPEIPIHRLEVYRRIAAGEERRVSRQA